MYKKCVSFFNEHRGLIKTVFFVISLEHFSICPKDTSNTINVTLETNKIRQKIFLFVTITIICRVSIVSLLYIHNCSLKEGQ